MQNAPEKSLIIDPPSPKFSAGRNESVERGELSSQVVANVEHNLSGSNVISNSNRPLEINYVFESKAGKEGANVCADCDAGSKSESLKTETVSTSEDKLEDNNSCDALELNIQEILALDIEFNKRYSSSSGGGNSSGKAAEKIKPKHMFKSLPNLSASSENLLV